MRSRRVEIFRKSISQNASGECNGMSHRISNWKGDATKEFIPTLWNKESRIYNKTGIKSRVFECKKKISRSPRVSKLEFLDGINWNFSVCNVGKCRAIFWEKNSLMIPFCSFLIEFIEILSTLTLLNRKLGFHFYPSLFRKNCNSLPEIDFLNFHEEINRTSTFSTRETMSNILGWRYNKRRTLFIMKRAESLVIYSSLLCWYISINDIKYLNTGFDILSKCHILFFDNKFYIIYISWNWSIPKWIWRNSCIFYMSCIKESCNCFGFR